MKSYRVRERHHENLLDDLLLSRGIADKAGFLNPDFVRDSHDPFLLPDMEAAVERILSALKNNELVAVWSDYDCDGIPGGVMLADFLRDMGFTVRHYIPHRHEEGYGLNKGGLDELAEQKISLIITIDLGSTEHKNIAYAKQKGIEVIVTDHHIVHELPPAVAVLNPKREDSRYPFNELCGSGVAWKLIQALQQKGNFLKEGQEKWFLDLVGLATLSDMVPLTGENRMLARFGLTVMRRMRRPGFSALLNLLRIKSELLTEDDIGFMVAPRINAASRMGNPHMAAKLLASKNFEEARELARSLQALNDERKGVVAATVKEVNKRLALAPIESPLIVMGNPNWRPGILGLVANSLVESHGKPVFLWGREGGSTIRGSVRSDGLVNVVELMGAARDVFQEFGGHAASGGFSTTEERVHELPLKLSEAYQSLAAQQGMVKEIVLEREVPLSELPHAHRELKQLAPFGIGNEKPLFMFPNVSVTEARLFGKQQNHLEFSLEREGARTSGIAFFASPDSFTKRYEVGGKADIVGHIENDWRGNSRIRVVDIL